MTSAMRLRSAGESHPGNVRSVNEDTILLRPDASLFAVADGMGGHENGRWASQTIAGALQSTPLSGDFMTNFDQIAGAVHAANRSIYEASQAAGAQMGSTAVVLYVRDGRFACAWAGDSRAYLLRNGVLHRLTTDHTQVQAMVQRGLLTPEEAASHPMGHVLSRAVGVQSSLELDVVSDGAAPRDVFLLCSDGLTGVVDDSEISDQLSAGPVDAACRRLLALTLERGAPDNVTVLAVACEEATALILGAA